MYYWLHHFGFTVGPPLARQLTVEYQPELLVLPSPLLKASHGVPSSFLLVSLVYQMEKLELPPGLLGDGGVKKEMGGGQEGGKGGTINRNLGCLWSGMKFSLAVGPRIVSLNARLCLDFYT